MNPQDVRKILAMIAGYWPTPALSEEEIIALTTELVGPSRLTCEEVVAVISAEKGRQWRPRPGELVGMVRHYRGQKALRERRPELEADSPATPEQTLAAIAECRAILTARRTAKASA